MNSRKILLDKIKENIGSRKVNIVFIPKGIDSEAFLMNDVKNMLEENYEDCVISYSVSTGKDDMNFLNSFISSKRKVFIMLNDLSQFSDPLSIINMFYGNTNIDVIATTSINIKRLAGKEITDIRGRYISYFYPPYLYGDNIDERDTIDKMFEQYYYDYRYSELSREIYFYILNHVGQVLSFRDIYSHCTNNVSLVTFVDIINYLHSVGLFYILPRIEIDSSNELNYGYVFYPCRAYDILSGEIKLDNSKRLKAYYDSMLVAKVFYDGQLIWSAFYVKKETFNGKRVNVQYNNCFLIKNDNQRVLLKPNYYSNNEKNLNMFIKYKGNIQKIIVSDNDRRYHMDIDGTLKCGIKYILEKGVFSYNGI